MPHPLALLAFVVLLVLVEALYGWTRLLAPWAAVPLQGIAVAVVLTLLSYWLRAMRVFDYFRPPVQGAFSRCLKLTLQHNLLNNLLPMRTGELSFPLLMGRYCRTPLRRSLPGLLWFRVLDLHTLAAFALVAFGLLWGDAAWMLPLAGAWLALPWLAHRQGARLRARWGGEPPGARLPLLAHYLLQGMPDGDAAMLRAWGWTLANWLVKVAAFAWVLGLFVELPVPAAWLGVIAGDLTGVLPVHGVAGAGTYEAGVVAALLPFGVGLEAALQGAINLHLFLLAATLLGGALSLLIATGSVRDARSRRPAE